MQQQMISESQQREQEYYPKGQGKQSSQRQKLISYEAYEVGLILLNVSTIMVIIVFPIIYLTLVCLFWRQTWDSAWLALPIGVLCVLWMIGTRSMVRMSEIYDKTLETTDHPAEYCEAEMPKAAYPEHQYTY